MRRDQLKETDVRLAKADAVWLTEIARVFGVERVDAVAASLEGQGKPGTPLRRSYDERQQIHAEWRAARCMDRGCANTPRITTLAGCLPRPTFSILL